MVAALALDRLDENRGHLVRRGDPLEHGVLDLLDTIAAEVRITACLRSLRIGDVMDVRNERREAAAVDQLGARKRHGAVGPAVKSAQESNGPASACVPAGQFQCRLQCLGSAVGEEDALGRRARRQLGESLRQVDLGLVIKIGAGHVNQPGGLVLNGGDDLGMAMPGRGHGDACREVEEQVPIDVSNHRPAAPLDDERIQPRVGRRNGLLVPLQQDLRVGTGQAGLNVRNALLSKCHISKPPQAADCAGSTAAGSVFLNTTTISYPRWRNISMSNGC